MPNKNLVLFIVLLFVFQTGVIFFLLTPEGNTKQLPNVARTSDRDVEKVLKEIQILKSTIAAKSFQSSASLAQANEFTPIDGDSLLQGIRNALKQEMQAQLQEIALAKQNTETESLVKQASGNDGVAYETAFTTVEAAIDGGIWTVEYSDAVIPHLSELSPGQRDALSDKYIEAVNAGLIDLRSSTAVPPF